MNSITDSMLRRRPWSAYPSINSLISSANIRAGSLPRNSRGRVITIFSSESCNDNQRREKNAQASELTDRSFFSFAVSFGLTFFLGIPVDGAFGMLVEAFLVVAFVVYVVSNS